MTRKCRERRSQRKMKSWKISSALDSFTLRCRHGDGDVYQHVCSIQLSRSLPAVQVTIHLLVIAVLEVRSEKLKWSAQ